MADVFQVEPGRLISVAAQKLKEKGIAKPKYIEYVKTGPSKERIPDNKDFWYIRSASLLRQVYIGGPIGVARLRTRYGSRKGHVISRHHHADAGGSIITDSLNALEKAGYIKKGKKGREITPSGRSFLDKIANEITRGA